MDEEVFFTVDGKEYCDEELALSYLLKDGTLFCNQRSFLEIELIADKDGVVTGSKPSDKIGGSTTILFVNCNDLFSWGTADSEDLPNDEIGTLYRMHVADPKWGTAKWCCFRRNMKPQKPAIVKMKEDGSWDEKMEVLPANEFGE